MPSLWIDLARNMRRAGPVLLLYAAITVALNLLMEDGFALAIVSLTLLFIFDYFLYRAALFDVSLLVFGRNTRSDGQSRPPRALGRYMLVSSLFAVVVGGPALLLGIALIAMGHPQEPSLFAPDHFFLWLMLFVMLLAFGTLFPAAAESQPFSPGNALHVAKQTWRSVGLQLLLLPGLGGLLLLLFWRHSEVALDTMSLPQPLDFLAETVLTAIHSVTHVFTIVILTRAYRQGWPQTTSARLVA